MSKIIVGMSGGVDSTIAAYLLKENNNEVIGATMVYDAESDLFKKNIEDARSICDKLGIRHIVKDVSKDFKMYVKDRFVNDYMKGITPPPCSICNGKVKFQFLIDVMKEEGAQNIATGHYAKVSKNITENSKRYNIIKSDNDKKDQSYMLYSLTQEEMERLILPIGDMDKEKVREISKKISINISEKKDSQDVCFIKDIENEKNIDKPYVEYIKRHLLGKDYKEKIARGEIDEKYICDICPCLKKGAIVEDGKVVAYHNGIINFTIGQRKGFNVGFHNKKYVIDIDSEENKIIIGDEKNLYKNDIYIKKEDIDTVYQGIDNINNICNIDTYVKVRYRDKYNKCKINIVGDYINIKTEEPIRAITRGQVAVVYNKNNEILFGGIIQNMV